MTTTTQTRPLTTAAPVTGGPVTGAPGAEAAAPAGAGGLFGLRAAVRTRRAQRSGLSRQIAAYPATRGVGVTVLPSGHHIAAPSSRFWV